MTSEQAQRLQQVKPGSQLSPMLERCCLRVSANVSYQYAAQEIEMNYSDPLTHPLEFPISVLTDSRF